MFENRSQNCECLIELNKLKDELQQKNNTIASLENQVKQLQEQNTRLKRSEQQLKKKFPLCEQCSII
jgi:predicted nuclease with TOPRIM domain